MKADVSAQSTKFNRKYLLFLLQRLRFDPPGDGEGRTSVYKVMAAVTPVM